MLASSVFGARPHLVLVVAHDRRGPYSALRACESGTGCPTGSRGELPSFPFSASGVPRVQWETESVCGFVWRFYGLPTTPAQKPGGPAQSQMQTPLTPRPSLRSGTYDPRAARASPRTDVQTRACGVKEPQPVDSRRHDADRPDPLDPRRRRANKDTKRRQTETGERRECEKLSRRGGRVGSPGGVWACTCTTLDERRS